MNEKIKMLGSPLRDAALNTIAGIYLHLNEISKLLFKLEKQLDERCQKCKQNNIKGGELK